MAIVKLQRAYSYGFRILEIRSTPEGTVKSYVTDLIETPIGAILALEGFKGVVTDKIEYLIVMEYKSVIKEKQKRKPYKKREVKGVE